MGATATGIATLIEPMVELTPRDLDDPAPRDTDPIDTTGAGANPAEAAELCDELMVYMNPRPEPLYSVPYFVAPAPNAHSIPNNIKSTFFKLITYFITIMFFMFMSFGQHLPSIFSLSSFPIPLTMRSTLAQPASARALGTCDTRLWLYHEPAPRKYYPHYPIPASR